MALRFNDTSINRTTVRNVFYSYLCLLFFVVFLTPNRYVGAVYTPNLVPVYETMERIHKPRGEHFWPYYIEYWGNLVGNVLLFMPFGFLLRWLKPRQSGYVLLVYGLATSVCIEALQWLLQIGVCDIDDVLLNVAGTLAGICLFGQLHKIKCRWYKLTGKTLK